MCNPTKSEKKTNNYFHIKYINTYKHINLHYTRKKTLYQEEKFKYKRLLKYYNKQSNQY